MRTLWSGIFLAITVAGFSAAQTATPNSPVTPPSQQNATAAQPAASSASPANKNTRIAPGSVIPVQLTKSIDVKKVKTGDEVDAQVTEDLKAGNGEIIVPKNTKVIGRVTEAQARSKEQKESQVGITFDRAQMNGTDMSLPMSIQAIIAPSYLSSANSSGTPDGSAPPPSSTPSAAGMPQGGNGTSRSGAMGTQQTPSPSATAGDESASASPRQPITGKTQGVLGISNVKLSTTTDPSQGSVVSSEKNNVKLEGGTLILLRVNQ